MKQKGEKNNLGFNPKISSAELEWAIDRRDAQKIESTRVYNLLKKLVNGVEPTFQDKFDTKWNDFYIPFKRSGRVIAMPLALAMYEKKFYAFLFRAPYVEVTKGKTNDERTSLYSLMFEEALKLEKIIKKQGIEILETLVPYDYRTGTILGKYVFEKIMDVKEKTRLLEEFKQHENKNLVVEEICLNDYLETASTCYKASYLEKTRKLTPLEMYKKWADGRHGGMLDIKNASSKEEFTHWQEHGAWMGSHPFEIVFSWHRHGIHLYPPRKETKKYALRVTNYAYARDYVKMADALMKKEIAFQPMDFQEVLDYLSGETLFKVNEYDEHSFDYIPSREYRKKYFKHIKWDELTHPKFKK